ncbi:PIN domain-like protein [Leucogyrophana mollusca]|uniref:PIN domain-like protein n=1 Tax=Leucogyrophana mollusca TaxID=85980 RepID=A0ACB8B6M0_9AGAM|nr:PIN domain-like protein [Leucogyrophana mollusca]
MGVHGLTTYLRENKRVLAKTLEFSAQTKDPTTVVVDGWSFIYELYEQSRLPWVYGGEYRAFSESVESVVRAWIAVGLHVYFVFDGAVPGIKIPTLVSRRNRENVERSLLFFRTSTSSRSTPRFLHETRLIPPLVQAACFHALEKVSASTKSLQVHFADEEGDPYAVELAGRLGGYVIGNDSDFVILNSGRYAGYISLDEMLWTTVVVEAAADDRDGEFQTVAKAKSKKKSTSEHRSGRGLIPPDAGSDLTLSVLVYTPSILASHFKIPVTLLPLLGALVGNDFSNQSSTQRNVQSLFFERHLTLSQRIAHVATTLNSILSASTQKRKAKHQVGSVMDLIDRTVHALLIRSVNTMASREVNAIIERIVNATLQYAIDKYEGDVYGPEGLWPTKICALHGSDVCRLPVLFSRTLLSFQPDVVGESIIPLQCERVRPLYIHAYRSGRFQPKLMDILSTGTFWPRLFLENPDAENVARSIGRPIREWIYALLEDAVGLPEAPEEAEDEDAVDSVSPSFEEEDEDELIDVVEEDSDDERDLLAPLRGELQRLQAPEGDDLAAPSASSRSRSRPPPRPKCVIEYVRRGTRVAPEEVTVPDIGALLSSSAFPGFDPENWIPIQLRPADERFTILLHVLRSDLPSVRALPPDHLIAALVLRWVAQTLHLRAVDSPNGKEREKERWTRHEARAFLASYMNGLKGQAPAPLDPSQEDPPVVDRNIQVMAQALMALEVIQHLSQVLLLSDQVPANVHRLSGRAFHSYLTGSSSLAPDAVPHDLWIACMDCLEEVYGEERKKKAKRATRGQQSGATATSGRKTEARNTTTGGLFGMLADMET